MKCLHPVHMQIPCWFWKSEKSKQYLHFTVSVSLPGMLFCRLSHTSPSSYKFSDIQATQIWLDESLNVSARSKLAWNSGCALRPLSHMVMGAHGTVSFPRTLTPLFVEGQYRNDEHYERSYPRLRLVNDGASKGILRTDVAFQKVLFAIDEIDVLLRGVKWICNPNPEPVSHCQFDLLQRSQTV